MPDLPPVSIKSLCLDVEWRMSDIEFRGATFPVMSVNDPDHGWRHYTMTEADMQTIFKWLVARG